MSQEEIVKLIRKAEHAIKAADADYDIDEDVEEKTSMERLEDAKVFVAAAKKFLKI